MVDHPPKQQYLSESQLFAGLSGRELDLVDQLSAMSSCEHGKVFYSPDDIAGTVYMLKEGRVRLFRQSPDGKKLTVAVLDRGAVFGENALLGQSFTGVYAEAAEPSLVCVMTSDRLRELIALVPRVALNLLEIVGQRLVRSQELAEEIAYWSVRRRLARLILDLDERYGHPTLDGGRVVNKVFTQNDLAEMVGSTRETIAELMSQLKKQDILGARRRRIVLQDRPALEQIVAGG